MAVSFGRPCYLLPFPDHTIEYKEGKVPPQIFLTSTDIDKERPEWNEAIQQSWGWPEVRNVVSFFRVPLLLTDLMAQRLEYKTRLELFHNAVTVFADASPCKAIYWITSQQFIKPAVYSEALQSRFYHPLQFALNVRLYKITNGLPGEMLMDTMGLSVLGLPDLQCHFHDLDPNQVARVLHQSAYYVYDKGDILRDGNTIQGIKTNDKWKCHHEESIMTPKREVVDLNPGIPYQAVNRK